uniref:Uncharacterized protein n=1 Tax=Bionectria ochroleuca TaxID=29856 RepID=A0A8H7N406_BIOOC
MPIICRKFTPKSTDILKDVWEGENGDRLYDTDATTSDLEGYIEECSTLLDNDLRASVSDDISKHTFLEAKRFALANPDSCVADALKIRLISYFCRESVIIVGDETLGIAKVEDTRFPIYGQVPVPSVLDFQIDTIAIHLMLKLIKSVVSRLKKIIYGRRNKEKWYEVYLTCFILLGCLEKVYSLQLGYMGMGDAMDKDVVMHVNYISRSMMEEWQYSAENLIFHFRCILRGMDPFSFDWEGPHERIGEAATTNLDGQAILYLRRVTSLLKEQKENIRGARNRIGAPLSWISELFLPDEHSPQSVTSATEA